MADPGSAKSPALDHARRPLDALQRDADGVYRELMIQWVDEPVEWSNAAKKTRGRKPRGPKYRDYYTTNTTIESLVGNLDTMLELTILKEVLVSVIASMDQYRGRKGSDRQQYLAMWSRTPRLLEGSDSDGSRPIRPVRLIYEVSKHWNGQFKLLNFAWIHRLRLLLQAQQRTQNPTLNNFAFRG